MKKTHILMLFLTTFCFTLFLTFQVKAQQYVPQGTGSGLAVGQGSSASSLNAIAVGQDSLASGQYAMAVGQGSSASSLNAIAVGRGSSASGESSIAVGRNAIANSKFDIALGYYSKTSSEKSDSTAGVGIYRASIVVDGREYVNNYADRSFESGGVVSIGAEVPQRTGEVGVFTRRLQGVSAGLVGEKSTDAINGSQLYQAYVDLKPTEVLEGEGIRVEKTEDGTRVSLNDETLQVLNIQKTKIDGEGVSVEGGPTFTRSDVNMADNRIKNVADAVHSSDAVTLRQLDSVSADLNQKIQSLKSDIRHLRKRNDAGTAAAMAMASLPQAYVPGKSMIAMSGGTFQGQNAMAIGISTVSKSGSWVFKLQGSTTAQNQQGFSAGVGYQF